MAGAQPVVSASPPSWELWRQDDNGNRVLMRVFQHEEDAIRERDAFEARGHKQTYWLQRQPPAARPSHPDAPHP